ncbi:DUF92 domain-containing protein [Chitinophaga sp. 212800010-3]|uniref:DUF92 domain-containing protein n=1 Tax=unclassified Chitinophaga TaxID=2619133 RepID=UPI002DE2D7A6|nr:DUF92 domain-containing protein [Chitinophaga sp. 212800010-3]
MKLSSFYELLLLLVTLSVVAIACIKTRKLTVPAALLAVFMAFIACFCAGYGGPVLLATFFVLGVSATAHKKHLKEPHAEKRNAAQVFANGGVATIMAVLAFVNPDLESMYLMMMGAALASAAADTVSSEMGILYGRRSYNILTFKPDTRGLDGVISLEGTLWGAGAAAVVALVYGICYGMDELVIWVFIGGVLGNIADSLLGATLERKKIVGNNTVNFLNTLIGAIVAMVLYLL